MLWRACIYRVTEQLTHRFVHSFCGKVACGRENNTNLPMIYRRCQPGLAGLCSLRVVYGVDFHHLVGGDKAKSIIARIGLTAIVSGRSLSKIAQPFSSMQSSFTDAATTLPTTMSRSARATDPTPSTRIKTPDPKYLDLLPKSDPLNICRCESLLD